MHHRVDALEAGGVDRAGSGIPPDVVGALGLTPNEPQHPVAVGAELGEERGPDEAVRSGHEHVHGELLREVGPP